MSFTSLSYKYSIFYFRFSSFFVKLVDLFNTSFPMQTFETYQSSDPLMIPIIPPNKSHFTNVSSFSSLPQLSKFEAIPDVGGGSVYGGGVVGGCGNIDVGGGDVYGGGVVGGCGNVVGGGGVGGGGRHLSKVVISISAHWAAIWEI